ncbi:hypothetical protein Bca4012_029812 [Brassica carinata]
MSLCYHRTAKRPAKEWKHSKGNTFVDHAENIVKLNAYTADEVPHPQLLFVYKEKHKLVFLSSPQPQNLDENSAPEAVNHLSRIPFRGSSCYVSGHVQGLVCLRVISKWMSPVQIICNPSTGQALTLPKIERMRRSFTRARNILGYDPIK